MEFLHKIKVIENYTEKKDMEISLLNLENFDSFSKIRNFPISKFSTSRFQFSEESFQISE